MLWTFQANLPFVGSRDPEVNLAGKWSVLQPSAHLCLKHEKAKSWVGKAGWLHLPPLTRPMCTLAKTFLCQILCLRTNTITNTKTNNNTNTISSTTPDQTYVYLAKTFLCSILCLRTSTITNTDKYKYKFICHPWPDLCVTWPKPFSAKYFVFVAKRRIWHWW